MQEMQVQSLDREDPLEGEMATYSSTFVGKSHKQRYLVGYSPWDCKQLDTTACVHAFSIYKELLKLNKKDKLIKN